MLLHKLQERSKKYKAT